MLGPSFQLYKDASIKPPPKSRGHRSTMVHDAGISFLGIRMMHRELRYAMQVVYSSHKQGCFSNYSFGY